MKTELKKIILEGFARNIDYRRIYIDHDDVLYELSQFLDQKVRLTIEEILPEIEEE